MKTSPKKAAFVVAAVFHFPLLFIGLEFPAPISPPDLPVAEVLFGLGRSLELALLQKETLWEVRVANLPGLLEAKMVPAIVYSSLILLDAKQGRILWAKPHPLLDEYLYSLRFARVEGQEVVTGYLAIGPKT